LALHRWQ